jgi:hypothetical protein
VTFHTVGVPLMLVLLMRTIDSPRPWRRAAQAGVGYGLLAYSLPSFLGSLVLMPLGLRLSGCAWRRALGVPLVALVVAVLIVSPWTVRNAMVHQRFVPVATNLGFNLAGANNPYSRPWINVLCPYDDIRWQVIDRGELESMNEADFDRLLLRQALAYMAAHPLETAGRMAQRAFYYWWITPQMVRYAPLQGWGGMVLQSVALPLAIAGLVVSWRLRRRAPWGVLYAACVWMTLFYMNFAIRGRYSLGIQPVLLILAVLGAAGLASWLGRRGPPARA